MKLNNYFQNGMMFQRRKPMPLWGYDAPGTRIAVRVLRGTEGLAQGEAVADGAGRWRLVLPPLEASFEPLRVEISGSEARTLTDVLVGDLYLAGGQSNMQYLVDWAIGGRALRQDHTRPQLRMLWMPVDPTQNGVNIAQPQEEYPHMRWSNGADEAFIGNYSAVAYCFARMLCDELAEETPVGIIDNSMGALPIETYLSRELVEGDEAILAHMRERGTYRTPEQIKTDDPFQMAVFHNAKVAPMAGVPLAGAIWYQGESNNPDPEGFALYLHALEAHWSRLFGGGAPLPFFYAHLAPHNTMADEGEVQAPVPFDQWAKLNEAMDVVWRRNREHSAQLPIYDIGAEANMGKFTAGQVPYDLQVAAVMECHPIHPSNKRPVGERMALAALGLIYGRPIAYHAPTLRDLAPREGGVLVRFDGVGRGLRLTRGSALRGFEICGESGNFVPASAEIVAPDTVWVHSEFVPAPASVNYAFCCANGFANLCNADGLPAVPFRGSEAYAGYAFNKEWAWCDEVNIWVDAGFYHDPQLHPIAGKTLRVNRWLSRPMVRQGSGYEPAWRGSPEGRIELELNFRSEGDGALRFTYSAPEAGYAALGPVLEHESLDNTFAKLRLMAFDLANGDGRAKPVRVMAETWDGLRREVPLTGDRLLGPGDEAYHTFVADLQRAFPPEDRERCLNSLRYLQIELEDREPGTIWVDNVRFAPV